MPLMIIPASYCLFSDSYLVAGTSHNRMNSSRMKEFEKKSKEMMDRSNILFFLMVFLVMRAESKRIMIQMIGVVRKTNTFERIKNIIRKDQQYTFVNSEMLFTVNSIVFKVTLY